MKRIVCLILLCSASILNGMQSGGSSAGGAGGSADGSAGASGQVSHLMQAQTEEIDPQTAYELIGQRVAAGGDAATVLGEMLSLNLNRNRLLTIARAEHNDLLINLLVPEVDRLNEQLRQQAAQGDYQKALNLLGGHADPRVEDAQGRTALHHAAFNGHANIIKLLVDWLLEEDTIAAGHAAESVTNQLENVAVGNLLNFLRQQDAEGRTALHLAAINGNPEALEMLQTMLQWVAQRFGRDRLFIAQIFTGTWRGLINARDHQGRTVLHLAALAGHEEAVNWLLAHGARNVGDNQGRSAHALVYYYMRTSSGKGKGGSSAASATYEQDTALMRRDEGARAAYERIQARLEQAFAPRPEQQPAQAAATAHQPQAAPAPKDQPASGARRDDSPPLAAPSPVPSTASDETAAEIEIQQILAAAQPADVQAAAPVTVVRRPRQQAQQAQQTRALTEARTRARARYLAERGGATVPAQLAEQQQPAATPSRSWWSYPLSALLALFSWEAGRTQGPKKG